MLCDTCSSSEEVVSFDTFNSYCPSSVLIPLHAASVLWHVCSNSLLCLALAGVHIKMQVAALFSRAKQHLSVS